MLGFSSGFTPSPRPRVIIYVHIHKEKNQNDSSSAPPSCALTPLLHQQAAHHAETLSGEQAEYYLSQVKAEVRLTSLHHSQHVRELRPLRSRQITQLKWLSEDFCFVSRLNHADFLGTLISANSIRTRTGWRRTQYRNYSMWANSPVWGLNEWR